MANRLARLTINSSALFVCDLQTKFAPSIKYFDQIVSMTNRLVCSANKMEMPILVTEQYPKGLGSIVAELDIKDAPVFAKTKFSMCIPEVTQWLKDNSNVNSIIICGIEAHVCVQQTTLDLIEAGYFVHIPVDAVSARTMADRKYAFNRMSRAGAYLTTSDSIIFELCGDAKSPGFKSIQKIVFDPPTDSGLF